MTGHSSRGSPQTTGGTCWPSWAWAWQRSGASRPGTPWQGPSHPQQDLGFQIKTLEILFRFFLQFSSLFALPHLPCPIFVVSPTEMVFSIKDIYSFWELKLSPLTLDKTFLLSPSLARSHLTDSGHRQAKLIRASTGAWAKSCSCTQSRIKKASSPSSNSPNANGMLIPR